jgi:hypothetical protein
MQAKCYWQAAPESHPCAVSGCPRGARLFCPDHPDEGYFCGRHRSAHIRSVARRHAELDSRPREPGPAGREAQDLEDRAGAMGKELTPEAA